MRAPPPAPPTVGTSPRVRRALALTASLACLVLGATASCAADDSGSSESTGTTTVTSNGTTTDSTSDSESGSASDTMGTSTTSSSSAGTTGSGTACSSNADCPDTEYCEFADDSCGASGVPGQCLARPTGCSADPRPVCGCDGEVHDGLCSAAAAGQDVEFLATCTPPAGAFACGSSYCIGGDEYCLQTGGAMPTFECIPLAPVCTPGNCFCMNDCCGCDNSTCCSEFCDNSTGQTVITCPG